MKHICMVPGSRPLSRSGVWDHVQLQEVVDAQEAENRAFDNPDLAAGLVAEQPGRRELDLPAAGEKLASTGRQHVLDPVRVRTVGQRNDEAATGTREDIDRSPVCLAGAASAVDYDTQPW